MTWKRVQQLLPQLKQLKRLSRKNKKKFIANCDKDFVHCICECVKNLLKGRLPLKNNHLKALARHKQSLRQLALKKTSLVKRKQILQRGGFLSLLLEPLVSSIISLATNGISKAYGLG